MKGTRPLDNTEIRQVADGFDGIFAVRNRGLFVLGDRPRHRRALDTDTENNLRPSPISRISNARL